MFNLPVRDPATTGFVSATATPQNNERGQYGIQLYRIADASLFSGATRWQLSKTVDTNLTGYECNFIAGLLRNEYGDVSVGAYPTIQMYPSISNPQPSWDATPGKAGLFCHIESWDIGSAVWSPNDGPLALNGISIIRCTRSLGHYRLDRSERRIYSAITIGHLYESSQNGATVPFYGCKSGSV